MLSFRVHQFYFKGVHYILLPKLNKAQLATLAERLERIGHSVSLEGVLTARSSAGVIHIDPRGLCWSPLDPADAVLPVIPEILSMAKEKVPMVTMKAMYFTAARVRDYTLLRVSTRVECASRWDELRVSGECGLAPDERAMVSFLLRRPGTHSMLTDFAAEGSTPRRLGGRTYFQVKMAGAQAAATLRGAGETSRGSSYLPRNNILRFAGRIALLRQELVDHFEAMGEWCYYTPV